MASTFTQNTILYQLLNADTNPLKAAITGAIYREKRPDSTLEDVVTNSLPVDNEPMQQGVANVNIYVPDIQLEGGLSVADEARLEELTAIAWEMLDEVDAGNWVLWVESQMIFEEPDIHMHYSNLRIQFRHVNY